MLTLDRVSFVSRGKTILDGVSAKISDSNLTCVVGLNGAGKTTLLRILSGELKAASGRFLIGDADATSLSKREITRYVSIIPQDVQPPPYLKVAELVELGRFRPSLAMWRRPGEEVTAAVKSSLSRCRAVSLSERPVEALSGGEQQRAWLAFGLAQEKKFLLLDETLDGLDVFAKRAFFELLKEAASEGTGMVLTTHDLELVSEYAEKVIVLNRGRVVYDGRPDVDVESCLASASKERQRKA
jgi:ABC-type cobalamin/Fe3+-siderophores transport system ATPase subunit